MQQQITLPRTKPFEKGKYTCVEYTAKFFRAIKAEATVGFNYYIVFQDIDSPKKIVVNGKSKLVMSCIPFDRNKTFTMGYDGDRLYYVIVDNTVTYIRGNMILRQDLNSGVIKRLNP